MREVELSAASSATGAVRVRAVFVGLVPASGALLGADALSWRGFTGKLGETVARDADGAELLVGVGAAERLDAEALRRAGAAIARAGGHAGSLVLDTTGLDTTGLGTRRVTQALGEGATLASYRFETYKSAPTSQAAVTLYLEGGDERARQAGVADALAIADAVGLARDLINTPGSDLTPVRFAETAAEVAADAGLEIEIYDEGRIAAERLGGILAVARGSAQPPRLVRLAYAPRDDAPGAPVVYFVGKGITFDSGGLAIKPLEGMLAMKTDMSGAAAVLGAMSVLARLGVSVRVVGLMPLTENMSGGNAVKPGDVLVARNGKTIEVANPDAEGRLVLADALSIAVEEGADAIVDLATLTGAVRVALGNRIAGVMGNDDRAIAAVRAAAARAGEPTWPLPLPSGYRDQIDSELADMKNTGAAGQAGTIAAGLLLEEFVGEVPWVHLDIAGTARAAENAGYLTKGGTGYGVRTLVELVRDYQPLGGHTAGVPEGKAVFR